MSHYAPDVVVYDLLPPLDVHISADDMHAFTGGGRADYWVRVTSGW